MFAKIYESEKYGQILVMRQTNDDGEPEIRVFCEPPKFGVCSTGIGFEEDDDGWHKRDKAFDGCDLSQAENAIEPIFNLAKDEDGEAR